MTPTPMPVCRQKNRLSTSPGSSPPMSCSSTGVNQGSYPSPRMVSTIWLPASSLPPNSAPFRAKRGTRAMTNTASRDATAIF